MNTAKQFWTLFKFQPSINPFILFMPLMFGMPLYLKYFMSDFGRDYHPDIDLLIGNQNLFFVGFIGVMWLAPEIFQFAAAQAMWANGTEFLLTRAVDRTVLYRARVAFFYLLIFAVPAISLLIAVKNPELQIAEYQKNSHAQVLSHLPGSIPAPVDKHGKSEKITIPNGNILVEGCHLCVFLCTAIGVQVLIFLIYPFKYRRFIFWAIYLGVIFLPLLGLKHSTAKPEQLSPNERMFFSFVDHQALFWLLTASALVLGQLWCEKRFARQEQ